MWPLEWKYKKTALSFHQPNANLGNITNSSPSTSSPISLKNQSIYSSLGAIAIVHDSGKTKDDSAQSFEPLASTNAVASIERFSTELRKRKQDRRHFRVRFKNGPELVKIRYFDAENVRDMSNSPRKTHRHDPLALWRPVTPTMPRMAVLKVSRMQLADSATRKVIKPKACTMLEVHDPEWDTIGFSKFIGTTFQDGEEYPQLPTLPRVPDILLPDSAEEELLQPTEGNEEFIDPPSLVTMLELSPSTLMTRESLESTAEDEQPPGLPCTVTMPEPLLTASSIGESSLECIVEKLHALRKTPEGAEILVQWEKFPAKQDWTWESESSLEEDVPDLLASWKSQQFTDVDSPILAHEVEEILRKKKYNKLDHYLVRWKGYEKVADRTWKPCDSLRIDVPHLVEAFESRRCRSKRK